MNESTAKTGHGEKRSRKEDQALVALLSETTMKEAATKTGIAEITLWRWMQDPAFQERYREARRQAVSQAITQLQKISSEAVQTLRDVMNDIETPPACRVTAAKAVLELAFRGMETEDLSARIEVLEKAAGGSVK